MAAKNIVSSSGLPKNTLSRGAEAAAPAAYAAGDGCGLSAGYVLRPSGRCGLRRDHAADGEAPAACSPASTNERQQLCGLMDQTRHRASPDWPQNFDRNDGHNRESP